MAASPETLSSLSVVSALPISAVLTGGCGALILVTLEGQRKPLAREEKQLIIAQVPKLTHRVLLIQRSLTAFYASVGLPVLSSVVTGSSALLGI